MEKNNIYTLGFLIALTAVTAIFSNSNINMFYIATTVLILSGIKFLLVAFNFMELKKGNTFWKVLTTSFLILFITIILIAKM